MGSEMCIRDSSILTGDKRATVYATTVDSPVVYTDPIFQTGDTVIFGSESIGLSDQVLPRLPPENQLTIPMMPANRSINLSNAVAIVAYEAWRQIGFSGASLRRSVR